jgi:glucose-6-phosphate 1-epimerase
MANITDLNARFGVPGIVTIDAGEGGLPRVRVTSPAAEAEVYLHGAHVTHFQPRGHKPVLFMSAASLFDPAKAIRGGVPLVFPWFGPNAANPRAPQHGFARTTTWTIRDVRHDRGSGAVTLTFALGPSDSSRTHWPHEFEAAYTVTVGPALDMAFEVANRSPGEIAYEEALHTYLAVGDVRQATVDGLAGREYLDKMDKARRKTQPAGAFTLVGETDRVYLNTPDTVTVDDRANGRRLVVSKGGSAATVVWNPWVDKSKAMADFGDDEWPGMLCVETANAAENAVKLAPGQRHVMRATVAVG